ncbi:3-phosphoshikimate 1-carboxyvinyltransferase [Boudabousia tangfeifanii]|uniref:3-phosphoshikimate 1-carboxyvinyltransferase n=1 Tax=Boudabousia tangfeifanii TaxID=1912795 RepID=A0A1D9MMS7_9ACTO|nr:3-phosphoshikimate 1-carboxyvinyltransferase [Boudabousia tangfeifanii]
MWSAPTLSSSVSATVNLPGSKSLTNRAFILAALSEKPTEVHGCLEARDTMLMRQGLTVFGARFEQLSTSPTSLSAFTGNSSWQITPIPKSSENFENPAEIDCGLSGNVMRFLTALAPIFKAKTYFYGDQGAAKRPQLPLLDALSKYGICIDLPPTPDSLPFTIGTFPHQEEPHSFQQSESKTLSVDSSQSSQFLSALLLAASRWPEPVTIRALGKLPSLPHIQMTLENLKECGASFQERENENAWSFEPCPLQLTETTIEPDLSNAGPFLAAAMIKGGQITIPNWPSKTTQAGDYWRELLTKLGASYELSDAGLTLTGPNDFLTNRTEHHFDLGDYGELAPTLAALLALRPTGGTITNIGHLRGHETDRLAALETEIKRLGGKVSTTENSLIITSPVTHGAKVQTYHDHRMATFGAIIGLAIPGIEIENVETTNKTLPNFVDLWQKVARQED